MEKARSETGGDIVSRYVWPDGRVVHALNGTFGCSQGRVLRTRLPARRVVLVAEVANDVLLRARGVDGACHAVVAPVTALADRLSRTALAAVFSREPGTVQLLRNGAKPLEVVRGRTVEACAAVVDDTRCGVPVPRSARAEQMARGVGRVVVGTIAHLAGLAAGGAAVGLARVRDDPRRGRTDLAVVEDDVEWVALVRSVHGVQRPVAERTGHLPHRLVLEGVARTLGRVADALPARSVGLAVPTRTTPHRRDALEGTVVRVRVALVVLSVAVVVLDHVTLVHVVVRDVQDRHLLAVRKVRVLRAVQAEGGGEEREDNVAADVRRVHVGDGAGVVLGSDPVPGAGSHRTHPRRDQHCRKHRGRHLCVDMLCTRTNEVQIL
eukprot:Rhum_TRINITY_DN8054_c0_g3::Rhum_TRINITY_DN8054_c0_g3_i1::g.25835::m.25835